MSKPNKTLKAFTLIELILAMTMVSFILLAGSHLDTIATRITSGHSASVALKNDLLYAMRVFEKDMVSAVEVIKESVPPTVGEQLAGGGTISSLNLSYTLHLIGPDDISGNPAYEIYYYLDVSPGASNKIFKRDYKVGASVTSTHLMPVNSMTYKLGDSDSAGAVMDPLYFDGKVVTLNLSAKKTLLTSEEVDVAGMSKSILVRTGAITTPSVVVGT